MHIQEGTNTTLTTCTKMTEEVDRRHGVNGNSSKGASEDAPVHNSTLASTGGRLKFFKDGKFILELVRGCGREGERAGWVSVPRKTFWPPAAPPAPSAAAPVPSAAALSLSDDNSSVQSSPWQRDHCWKQAAPRRNLSKELALYYCRPATLPAAAIAGAARAKRRRPHDTSLLDPPPNGLRKPLTNGVCDNKRNGNADSPSDDAVDGSSSDPKPKTDDERWTDYDREKYYHMKLKKPYQYHKLRVYKKTKSPFRRKELNRVVDKLRERIASLPAPVNAKLANCRQEHMMVSPRKRILRELERVSLEDQGMKRRAKTVPALSTASYPPPPGPSHAKPPPDTTRTHNGSTPASSAPAPRRDQPVSKNVSSYSIHSLLSMPDEGPRRSPDAKRPPSAHSYAASLKTESPGSVRSPDLSPSPDGYRYRYSALALGSPGPGVARDSPTPPSELARYRYAGTPGPPPAPPSPYGRTHWPAAPAPPYRAGAAVGAVGPRDEWRDAGYVYGYGFAPLLRPPPLWMHYAMAPAAPPGPWAPAPGPALPHPHPLLTDHIPKDEPTSDLPLNLSKH